MLDLAALLPAAEVAREAVEIDLGTPPARAALGAGWSSDERRASGLDFVWSVGRVATVDLFVATPRELPVRFRCRPFSYPGAPTQIVEMRIGGTAAATLELAPGWNEYQVSLPRELLVSGRNQLELAAAYAMAPAQVLPSSDDQRPLAVAWDWIRIGATGAGRGAWPAVDTESSLQLASDTEAAWFVEGYTSAVLVAEAARPAGSAGWLEVWWQTDREGARRLARQPVTAGRLRLPLPAATGPARLALRAVGGDATVAAARLEVLDELPSPSSSASGQARTPPLEGTSPNVVLYSVDTLRADRLGCYGCPAGLTPRLDALATTAAVFSEVRGPTSWTKPSLATLLTGLGSLSHGLNLRRQRLPDAATTLAEAFGAAGYTTGAFVTNAYLTRGQGFEQGFDWYVYDPVDAATATVAALTWLDGRHDDRPFLLWVHTIDPHAPYVPHPAWRQRFAGGVAAGVGSVADIRALGQLAADAKLARAADYRRLYDAEVAQNDAAFGALVDGLAARGHDGDTVIAFLSDHGEAFLERGLVGHGNDLYEETVRVPLVIRPAGGTEGRRVEMPVKLADVAPTLLAAAGLAAVPELDGRDLWPAVTGAGPAPSDRLEALFLDHQDRHGAAARRGHWKMIAPIEAWGVGRPELYDLGADPGEHVDRAGELPVTAGWLAFEARRALASSSRLAPESAADLDDATRRDLEALGYVVDEE